MTRFDRDISPQHPEGLTGAQEVLANELFKVGAVKFGSFRLKLHDKFPEAPLSPVYFDFRVLPFYPEVMATVADVYAELAKSNAQFDACLGIPDAGIPLATAFALRTGTPQVVVRKDTKMGHGIQGRFMTPYNKDDVVLVIDDLITRADSKLEMIEVLEQAGMEVNDVVVLLDRDQGGREQLAKRGVTLHSAFEMDQLLTFYARTGELTYEQHQEIKTSMAELNKYLATT